VYEVTGKVPSVVFAHQEKPKLKPLPATPFNTDDVEGTGVTKTFRVSFDRNKYSVPWRLASQQVIVRADNDSVAVFLSHKQVAIRTASSSVGAWSACSRAPHHSTSESGRIVKFDFRSTGGIVTGRVPPVVATCVTAGVTADLAEASETVASGVTPGVTTGVTSVPAGASTVEASPQPRSRAAWCSRLAWSR
jgi:hypothetical protein